MKTSFNTPTPQSIIELYMELDSIEWYYKFLAGVANWAMLAGFIVFPNAFDDDHSRFQIDADTLRVVAVCLLVFGYILTGILCWRFKNLLFQVESIFLPGFTSSTIGFMSSLFNVYGKTYKNPQDQWSASAILAIVLSSVFMLLYGATSLNANRKIDGIRKLDEYRRQVADSHEDVALLTEEERTRRNLLALLLSPQQQQAGGAGGIPANVPAFEPRSLYSSSTSHLSRLSQSQSYPNIPSPNLSVRTGGSNSGTHLMSNHPAYSPPSGLGIGGTGRNSGDGLLSSPGANPPSRWDVGRSPSLGEISMTTNASTSTAYISPARRPIPPAALDDAHLPEVVPSGALEGEKEVVGGPQKRKSIFAGISATVGHGRERVGAGWTSWSPV